MFAIQLKAEKPPVPYLVQIATWRDQQQGDLSTPEGWLSVVGLYWLKPGENSLGTDPGCSLRLSNMPAAPHVGTITLSDGKVSFVPSDQAKVSKDGSSFAGGELRLDQDRFKEGRITYMAIKRGSRIGLRVFDPNCTAKIQFSGMHWFSANPAYKVQAKFTPYAGTKTIPILNVIGDTSLSPNPGYVTFDLNGKHCRLEAQSEGSGLFLNFADLTTGKSTYPAGRFLYTSAPVNGQVEIDFNKAVNPPCAFTAFATCPLPPKINRLDVVIEAGEKVHHPGQEEEVKPTSRAGA